MVARAAAAPLWQVEDVQVQAAWKQENLQPTNGQGEFQGRLSEHLFLNNSDNVRAFLRRKKGNLADSILLSTEPWEARVDRLFLAVLTRLPSTAERGKFVTYLQSDPKPEPLVEEALWVLVNLSEFRFN